MIDVYKSSYSGTSPKISMPTLAKAVIWRKKIIKNVAMSLNILTQIRMIGPKVAVSCSMLKKRIQKKKEIAASRKSKWNYPVLILRSTASINVSAREGSGSRPRPSFTSVEYTTYLLIQIIVQTKELKSRIYSLRSLKWRLVSLVYINTKKIYATIAKVM